MRKDGYLEVTGHGGFKALDTRVLLSSVIFLCSLGVGDLSISHRMIICEDFLVGMTRIPLLSTASNISFEERSFRAIINVGK